MILQLEYHIIHLINILIISGINVNFGIQVVVTHQMLLETYLKGSDARILFLILEGPIP